MVCAISEIISSYNSTLDPVGKRIKWGGYENDNPWMEVIGVVGQVKVNGVVNAAPPQLYIPHWQDNDDGYYLLVKSRGEPLNLVEPIRRMVSAGWRGSSCVWARARTAPRESPDLGGSALSPATHRQNSGPYVHRALPQGG